MVSTRRKAWLVSLVLLAVNIYGITYFLDNYNVKNMDTGVTDSLSPSYLWPWQPKITWQKHFLDVFESLGLKLIQSESIGCAREIPDNLTENLHAIDSYKFNISMETQAYLSLDPKGLGILSSRENIQNMKDPVIVTAASYQFYPYLQAFFENVHRVMVGNQTSFSLIFYDLGLQPTQKEKVMKYCKCQYRMFPYDKFPKHVQIGFGFAWKPIIIQLVLKEHDLVIWADTSIRFLTSQIDDHVESARQVGIKMFSGGGKVYQKTLKTTFDKLGEEPCLFGFPEVQAGFSVISRSPFTLEYIMKPWVFCALTEGCMVVPNNYVLRCFGKKEYHQCHRFDQSVFSILITRLYGAKRRLVYFKKNFADVFRHNRSSYFDKLSDKDVLSTQ